MSVNITLDQLETLVVQAMRKDLASMAVTWRPTRTRPIFDQIDLNLNRFIVMLSRIDPFVVRLRPLFDQQTTLFERQLLYVICEERRGNAKAVKEVLLWWFPEKHISEAHKTLRGIADALNETEFTPPPPSALKTQMLLSAITRPSQGGGAPVTFTCNLHPTAHRHTAETVH